MFIKSSVCEMRSRDEVRAFWNKLVRCCRLAGVDGIYTRSEQFINQSHNPVKTSFSPGSSDTNSLAWRDTLVHPF